MKAQAKKSSARRRTSQRRPKLSGRALKVGRRRIPLYSGAIHYWRMDPSSWRSALVELKNLGVPIAETYVPWGPHERGPGDFDFGDRDPRLDLAAFLDLAHEVGLYVFVRPGPHINAELTYFGLPERIVYDRACQARSPQQNPVILPWPPRMFPIPSYASRAYHRETGRWYDAVARIVGPRMHPEGPVVLVQIDNEASYYFRNGPYDQDYHPDAVEQYRGFLERRYGSVASVGQAHGIAVEQWEDVEPPTRFSASAARELVVHLDWAEFQEEMITRAIGRMRRRLARAGVKGLPTVHNLPLGDGGLPVNIPALSQTVDLTGFDYYHPAREHRAIKRRTLYLAGTFELPYSPELGVGAPPWFTPLHHEDSLYCTMCALAYGLRGFNLYMAVDRDRWYGAPIDATGTPRIEASVFKTLIHQLRDVSFHELERRTQVALVLPMEYRRLSRATHLLGGVLSPSALEAVGGTPVDACREDAIGFKGPIQVLWWRMLAKISDALTRAGIPYVYVDSEAPPERLASMQLVFAPSYEFASVERWKRLAVLARSGTRVVYGPAMPELDVRMRPQLFEVPKDGMRVLVDTPEDADALVADLANELELDCPFPVRPRPLETAVHEDAVGPRVLFVMNPGRAAKKATIDLPAPLVLVDALHGDRYEGHDRVEIPVAGLTTRMFVLEPPTGSARRERKPPSARRKAS